MLEQVEGRVGVQEKKGMSKRMSWCGTGSAPSSASTRAKGALYVTGLLLLVSCLVLYHSADPFRFLPSSFRFSSSGEDHYETDVEQVLKKAAMPDGTVILTTMNEAWAEAGSIMDIFLESFRLGNNTEILLKHLVIISLDQKAHNRCSAIHPHCYALKPDDALHSSGEAYFMTPVYLEMMWRRIRFLASVLQMGYSFVFTDADIVWLRDPFPRFYADADFQIACDNYLGNSSSRNNQPNGGFNYVKSNERTILFYKYWYASRNTYPGEHDQDVLNKIKYDSYLTKIGLQMRFLDTAYFGGFCEPSEDFSLVCTMHANCCFGMENKVHDLNLVLEDWRRYMSSPANTRASPPPRWRAPQNCSLSAYHPPNPSN